MVVDASIDARLAARRGMRACGRVALPHALGLCYSSIRAGF